MLDNKSHCSALFCRVNRVMGVKKASIVIEDVEVLFRFQETLKAGGRKAGVLTFVKVIGAFYNI